MQKSINYPESKQAKYLVKNQEENLKKDVK